MTRRMMILAALAVLTCGAGDVLAHERFRIVGTITRRQTSDIEVLTQTGKKIRIAMNKQTVVTRDKKPVAATELKKGRSVVVDALGDDYTSLVAEEVRLVPAIPPAQAKEPVLVRVAAPLRAHEAFRFVGTITKHQGTQLGVKIKVGRTVYVELTKTTIVLRDKTKVPATALKPGLSVVVDALGDDDSDLTAKQVRIVPALAPPPAKKAPR